MLYTANRLPQLNGIMKTKALRLRELKFACRVVGAAVWLGTLASPAGAQWTVVNLHPAGTVLSAAYGVGTGQQVGYVQVGPTVGHSRASLWSGSAGSWVNLHPTGVGYSIGYAADGGQQVGEYYPAGFPRAAMWTGTAASWVDLQPAGESQSSALGVGGGQQVGRTSAGYHRAALWSGSAGTWVDLNIPPTAGYTHSSEAYATDGHQQVGYLVAVGGIISASLWSGSAGSWVNLHPAGNISSWAYGVGGGQQVGVVRVPDTSSHAALWSGSAASWVDLHPAVALNSQAYGVSGGLQVGRVVIDGVIKASLWSGSAASRVDLHAFLPASFVSSEARSISTEGANTIIAGFGYNSLTQRSEAVIWTRPNLTVSGQIVFNEYVGPPITTALIEYKDLAFAVVHSEMATLSGSGNFSVPSPPAAGNYYVSVQTRSWLRRTIGPVNTSSSVSGLVLDLVNGDIDHDNEIGIGDYAQLSATYGLSPGDPGYMADADINGDDAVDIGDYAILSANYGIVGDN